MKNIIFLTALLLVFAAGFMYNAHAQAPQRFNYQGVARDASGTELVNITVGLRLTIRVGSASGTSVYQETHTPTTNAFGVMSVQVGGGSGGSGFSSIDWGSDSYYLQAELDPAGGTTYQNMGTSQLLSVPYALYAANGGSGSGSSASLDQAYDAGGSGAGRTVTADAGALKIQGTDGVLVTGIYNTGATLEASGEGARMFFNPRKAAFRAGRVKDVSGSESQSWNESNVGTTSVAMGFNPVASGDQAIALGTAPTASGPSSIAIGTTALASGQSSTAFGSINAHATGDFSTAIGNNATATGSGSLAAGNKVRALSFGETALGYNSSVSITPTPNPSSWVDTDRLLVVGNGSPNGPQASTGSDALVILKNGNTGIGASNPKSKLHLHAEPGADIQITDGTTGTTAFDGLAVYYNSSGAHVNNQEVTPLIFYTSSVERIVVSPSGNVGIGVLAPTAAKLEVNGQVKISGGAPGVGKVLTSDANGLATWQTAGGVSGWGLTGNAGTVDNTNFIGTTDNIALSFRVNNVRAGRLSNNNTSFGYNSFNTTATGSNNVALGNNAAFANTTGYSNVAVGVGTLLQNDRGNRNVAVGDSALYSNRWTNIDEFSTAGNQNTAVGSKALHLNTDGQNNAALGVAAGYKSRGSNNVFIGKDADVNNFNVTYTNSIAIGANTVVTASQQVRIGNGVTSIGGPVAWTNTSDGRFKTRVTENVPGLAFIANLRPVSYNFNWKEMDMYLTGKPTHTDEHYAELGRISHTGFIAQEVEQAAKAAGFQFSGVDAPKNDGDVYGLRYSEFVVPLVKAVQEQQDIINELRSQIAAMAAQLQAIQQN
jgi:hypothetical protein